jgi:glycosyltransferase involved in cell wall biosynthesis
MNKLPKKVLFFANTEWYLFNFRIALAKHLRELGTEVVMVSPYGGYGKKLEEQGFRWIPVNMARRSLNPITELKLLWDLYWIYKSEKPDIAHHFTIKCVVYGGLVSSLTGISGVISAVTGLGYVFIGKDLKARILRPLVRQLLSFVIDGKNRRLILQNRDDQSIFLAARLIKNDRIRIIAGSGVDTNRFIPQANYKPMDNKTAKIVFAARLLKDKGLSEFVEAGQILQAQGIAAEFIIAGNPDPGNPASVDESALAAWRALPGISMLGHVDDMVSLLKTADIMVLPSYREGLPRSLIEAAAAGIPIVTTDAPGCRDVVEDGVNGFLVPVADSNALATALIKIITNPKLAEQMSEAGRKKALAEFDENIVFDKTLSVYQELTN